MKVINDTAMNEFFRELEEKIKDLIAGLVKRQFLYICLDPYANAFNEGPTGACWEKDDPAVQRSYANSPHLFVDKWDTPILCIHGEKDFRILASQGMAAFNAAILRGVPAELLVFPDENHWVLKPQNGILWQRTFFRWLDKWLKN